MGLYEIGKCDYCGDRGRITRPSPFMGDRGMMCEYCWNETQKEYGASEGTWIDNFDSKKEEYKEIKNNNKSDLPVVKVRPVVCDYGVYINDELQLILTQRQNAELIKSILEIDLQHKVINICNNSLEDL